MQKIHPDSPHHASASAAVAASVGDVLNVVLVVLEDDFFNVPGDAVVECVVILVRRDLFQILMPH